MMKRFSKILTAAALAAGLMISCSKDKDTTSYNYLEGNISYSIPHFVAAGDVIEVTPTGISHPEGEPFGIYWTVTSLKESRDTVKRLSEPEVTAHFSFTVPDTLGNFTMSVTAFAPDYYASSTTQTFTIISPSLTLDNTGITLDSESVTDSRDGKRYAILRAGGLHWMRQNLAWDKAGTSFDYCPATDPVFGRFYSWKEAQTACPEGWRLPTDAEWTALVAAASGLKDLEEGETFPDGAGSLISPTATYNTQVMWQYWPAVSASDAIGFCALPFGYGNLSKTGRGTFTGLFSYAAFWTSDEADGMGRYRYINVNRPEVFAGSADKELFAASIRCVLE